ncbi:hypothetical protein HOP50_01g04000 [Chloropicon primus]|uniref:Uncharacterized protein n=1 Tax=Chloropicon primus TaxID=1764295 RepID=A0A5B8MCT1_9CHLO|nr:hypothetical protein A3770_01p04120 [Chloropicon primus]UPQ97109.1 hypothetical protein HOP50_01g04000 [Chloropicon primus]|mmetsp:Transcript_35328/g.76706  ORF Transcript_35328/g.76706 Transcript_35328/m.76706 type:complete len:475 (+) Transcript_35328:99-1523(+)|eukprot:QDZ17894.1 hypothetical protein A3770_01p04120 [Chloropicon primus]
MKSWIAIALAVACLAGVARAVQHGDEKHGQARGGYFFAFTNGDCTADYSSGTTSCGGGPRPAIDVVDPASMEVVASVPITTEYGPVVWSDAVYMEACDDDGYKGYVIANERGSRIVVIDAAKAIAGDGAEAIITTLPMGSRPVHSYAIPHIEGEGNVGEFWSHSDGDGHFDVVKVGNWDDLHVPEVTAHVETPGHGKLLWDSDLWPYGYASNTNEGYLYEIDMRNYNMTRHLKFTTHGENPDAHCKGTHGLAYSKENKHIYATCSGNTTVGGENGLVEVNVEGDELVLVKKHTDARGGQVYESSDGKWIVDIDKSNDEVVFLEANEPGEVSSISHVIEASADHCALDDQSNCGGMPDKVAFYDMPDGSVNFFFSFTSPNDKKGNDGVGYINSKDLGTQKILKNVKGGSGASKYRSIYTGGDHVATIMSFPHDGLMIVDGETGELAGTVETNQGTTRVIYVPNAPTGFYCSGSRR